MHTRFVKWFLTSAIGILALLVPYLLALAQQPPAPHFSFTGPLSRYLAPGAASGQVSGGLPFTIELTNNGASVAPDSFDIKGTRWNASARLSLEGLKFNAGALSAEARLSNGSGSVLEGVRLDITGATEEYRAKDPQGREVNRTRPQPVSIASPLLFGDIPDGQDADPAALSVTGITFKPETIKITVRGIVSGLYFLGGFNVAQLKSIPEMDTDAHGRLYFANVVGKAVVRSEADGSNASPVAALPDQCVGVAIDRRNGDIYATAQNNPCIFHFDSNGRLTGKVEKKDGLNGWTHNIRVRPDGALFSDMSGSVVQIDGGKAGAVLSQISGERLGTRLFDTDREGKLWICTSSALFHSDMAGKTGRRIATGPDWHLGGVTTLNSCRVDTFGQVYVTENDAGREAGRISVFDHNGRVVRVFGRGAKTPITGSLNPGQVFHVYDIAFGEEGKVYVLHAGGLGTPTSLVLTFQPF